MNLSLRLSLSLCLSAGLHTLIALPTAEASPGLGYAEAAPMVESTIDFTGTEALAACEPALAGPAAHPGLELLASAIAGDVNLDDYYPDLPTPPDAGNVTVLTGGSHTLLSNRTYRLTGNVGILTIPAGARRIAIDGQGRSAAGVRFPAQWASSPLPKCWDIRVANLRRVGGDTSAFQVYGERILLEFVRCEQAHILNYGVYSWGGRHITLRDSFLHTQGREAATRFAACEHVAVYRCDLGTPSKHSLRVHASGGDSRWILWADNRITSPMYIGYQTVPTERLIEHIVVINNRYDPPTIVGNNSWFQHAPAQDSGGPKLRDFYFLDNSGPGTTLSLNNLNGLIAAASSTWTISGNQH